MLEIFWYSRFQALLSVAGMILYELIAAHSQSSSIGFSTLASSNRFLGKALANAFSVMYD